jgi:hypothetical protein
MVVLVSVAGCVAARGISDVRSRPYPVTHEDDAAIRFGDKDDNVLVEVKKTPIPRRLDNLAIHYRTFFPGGEIIRPGDYEEYVKVDGKNAYKVTFRTEYIRQRKRVEDPSAKEKLPEGWTLRTIVDPITGKPTPVLYGPIIPRCKLLYLVEGNSNLYYILMRADGSYIPGARREFDDLVHKGIDYK